jgi:hypothetical protein
VTGRKTCRVKPNQLYLQLRFKRILLLYTSAYKKIIALLLLAVYCFVAIPSAALHSHVKKAAGENKTSIPGNVIKPAGITSASDTEGVCKICAHHFQVHDDNSYSPSLTDISFAVTAGCFPDCDIQGLPLQTNFNKGPPVLI